MARPKRPKPANPICTAIQEWLDTTNLGPGTAANAEQLLAEAPKRWSTYDPMVLLPSGSFSSPSWMEALTSATAPSRDDLWQRILHHIGTKTPEKPTHLAVNDGIPLTTSATEEEEGHKENILRSPIGLRTLYGDFGPAEIDDQQEPDFDRAFWVSTKQNGIYQTWAPRWTMFSRGNIKEKARLLALRDENNKHGWAVDLFAGIGYFVFSYAARGMRVLCWEVNPWSVEGLRRGAVRNGWRVRVVRGQEALRLPTWQALMAEKEEEEEEAPQIVVFLEDNCEAARRVEELRMAQKGLLRDVRHVNLGLLPRSDDRWEDARGILSEDGGCLHLHENVGVKDIESRKGEIEELFVGFEQRAGDGRRAHVEHVELVKTFAPDVWHCVFDVRVAKEKQ